MIIDDFFINVFQSSLKNDIVIKDIDFDDENIRFLTYNLYSVYSQTYTYNIKVNDFIIIEGYNNTKKQQEIVKRLARLIIKYKSYATKNLSKFLEYYNNIQQKIFNLKYNFEVIAKMDKILGNNRYYIKNMED
jgi:hypothetical protein